MNHIRHIRTLKKKRTHKELRLGGANIHSRISGFFLLQKGHPCITRLPLKAGFGQGGILLQKNISGLFIGPAGYTG